MSPIMLNYEEKRDRIIAEYPSVPTAVLAKKYGMKTDAIKYIAKSHGIRKDFAAQREYKEAHKPPKPVSQRKKTIQQLIADYPYYSNAYLANKYHMSVNMVRYYAACHHVNKDFDAIRKYRCNIYEEYATRPTDEVAAEMGLTKSALQKRANRAGIHKTVCTSRPRKYSMKERTVLAFANNHTVAEIAASTGIRKTTIYAILKRNGITPKSPLPTRVVIQWTLDGKFVARHSNCALAAKSLPRNPNPSNIFNCCKGIGKSAYGYRWTIEKL